MFELPTLASKGMMEFRGAKFRLCSWKEHDDPYQAFVSALCDLQIGISDHDFSRKYGPCDMIATKMAMAAGIKRIHKRGRYKARVYGSRSTPLIDILRRMPELDGKSEWTFLLRDRKYHTRSGNIRVMKRNTNYCGVTCPQLTIKAHHGSCKLFRRKVFLHHHDKALIRHQRCVDNEISMEKEN